MAAIMIRMKFVESGNRKKLQALSVTSDLLGVIHT